MLPKWYVVIYDIAEWPGYSTLPDGSARAVNYVPERFGCNYWSEDDDGTSYAEIRWTRGSFDTVRLANVKFFKSLDAAQRFHDGRYSQDRNGRAETRLTAVTALTKTLAAKSIGKWFMVPTGEVPVGGTWQGKPPRNWQPKR